MRFASRIESILTPVGMDVEEVPPLGEVGDVVVPSVAVEVTALRIATAVAAVAGLFVVAQALGRQLAAAAAEDGVRSALGITSAEQAAGKWLTFAPAALAGAAAVPIVAWAVSGAFPRGLARRAEVEPGMRFDTWAIVAGATATLALDPRPPRRDGVACIAAPPAGRCSHGGHRVLVCSVARCCRSAPRSPPILPAPAVHASAR